MKNVLTGLMMACLMAGFSKADPIGPVYPAPGGTTFSGSGSSGSFTGSIGDYSGFDSTQYTNLYWTYSSIANPTFADSSPASPGNMTFLSYNATSGVSLWESTTNLTFSSVNDGNVNTPVFLSLQFQPDTGTNSGLLSSGFLVPTTAGAAGITSLSSSQSVLEVPGNFQIWVQYTVSSPSGQDLNDFLSSANRIDTSGRIFTSSSGGFYYTVPEPSTWVLMLLGSLGLVTFTCVAGSCPPSASLSISLSRRERMLEPLA